MPKLYVKRVNLVVFYTLIKFKPNNEDRCSIYSDNPRKLEKLGYLGSHPISSRVFELFNLLPKGSLVPAKERKTCE